MTLDELNRLEQKLHDVTNQSFIAGLITGILICLSVELIIWILI
jgi:formate/nitrite transporter FocA (FNT family)